MTKPAGFFDPLGLSKNLDADGFAFYRTAELKHGRVCQLAVLGYIAPEIYRFPGDIAPGIPFASIPNGLAAIESVPTLGWLQMAFLVGYVDYELTTKGSAGPRWAMLAVLELFRHDSQMLVGGMYAGDEVMGRMITGLPFLYQQF